MKNYLLDTTVLLHDAQALFNFGENNVIIPIPVIEDVDHFKKDVSEIGRSARQVSRILDRLRQRASLASGVPLEDGGRIVVKMSSGAMLRRLPEELQVASRSRLGPVGVVHVLSRTGSIEGRS